MERKAKPENTEVLEITEKCPLDVSALNRLTERIIGAAIEVHRNTGPGLMESVYEECLCYEMSRLGVQFRRQVELPIEYKQIKLNCGFRMDLVVEDAVVLELKAIDQLLPVHSAQLLTYLKLSGIQLGLLINFNETALKKGLKRLTILPQQKDSGPSVSSVSSVISDFVLKVFSVPLCLCGEQIECSNVS